MNEEEVMKMVREEVAKVAMMQQSIIQGHMKLIELQNEKIESLERELASLGNVVVAVMGLAVMEAQAN